MLRAEQPIGIFDSGIGGLTVAKAIHCLLPNENLIYFGDTAHSPWGSQSATAIQHYATKISQTLLDHDCKIIVIACNTASAAAFTEVKSLVSNKALLFNVIDPVIQHLVQHHQHQTIGLIGTKQTIKSQAYKNRLQQKTSNIHLQSLATPLLVPLIEEGFGDSNAAQEIIQHYLNNPILKNISALILGCTHYPLIKNQIRNFLGPELKIIDSATLIASVIAEQLKAKNLNNTNTNPNKTFYVSHDSDFFNHTAQRFFPENITLQTYNLWD